MVIQGIYNSRFEYNRIGFVCRPPLRQYVPAAPYFPESGLLLEHSSHLDLYRRPYHLGCLPLLRPEHRHSHCPRSWSRSWVPRFFHPGIGLAVREAFCKTGPLCQLHRCEMCVVVDSTDASRAPLPRRDQIRHCLLRRLQWVKWLGGRGCTVPGSRVGPHPFPAFDDITSVWIEISTCTF